MSVDVIWPRSLAEIGTFIGGAVGPIAVIWLVGTFLSQREELSETRRELARQAEAQENTHKVILAQQVLLRLPAASQAIFRRFWEHIPQAERTRDAYESDDLAYVTRRFTLLTPPETFYGTPESRAEEMQSRGVLAALEFAEAEIRVLGRMADEADATGALRSLVEATLRAADVAGHRARANKHMEANP